MKIVSLPRESESSLLTTTGSKPSPLCHFLVRRFFFSIGAGISVKNEMTSSESSQLSVSTSIDTINPQPEALNQGDVNQKLEFAEEEIRSTLEAIASTGKFWHTWEQLKSMISFQLKQVLAKYPEAKMRSEQQNTSLEETYPDLVKRLDEALLNFIEGPPFTVQRICEILLDAQGIYPNLSKLALALEKNLLVTSTLLISTEPCSLPMAQRPENIERDVEEPKQQLGAIENGIEPTVKDGDEVMTEVEEIDISDDMTMDMEALDEIVGPLETNANATGNSPET